jgi:hypothetical protein
MKEKDMRDAVKNTRFGLAYPLVSGERYGAIVPKTVEVSPKVEVDIVDATDEITKKIKEAAV